MRGSISDVRKEIDALRNVTKLLLGQYMLPPGPQSMITVLKVADMITRDVSVSMYTSTTHSTFTSYHRSVAVRFGVVRFAIHKVSTPPPENF